MTTPPPTRRADPLAAGIYQILLSRPEVDLRHVAEALAARFPFEADSASQTRALEALRTFASDMKAAGEGTNLSKRRFNDWRRTQRRHGYPDSKTIVAAFGGWDAAIIAATFGVKLDLRTPRMIASHRFSEHDLIEAINCYFDVNADHPATLAGFLEWCAAETSTPSGKAPARLPLRSGPIQRYGGWVALLHEAGHSHRITSVSSGLGPGVRREYTEAQMLEHLRRAAAEHSGELTGSAYITYRRNAIAAGQTGVPSRELYISRFGKWSTAKAAAGLIVSPRSKGGSSIPYTPMELAEAVMAAQTQTGRRPISGHAYERWRKAVRSAQQIDRIPSALVIRQNLGDGSFPVARARALAMTSFDD